jgi:CDP-glucose 4,6-dehydratase
VGLRQRALEDLVSDAAVAGADWRGRSVLVTGHTGFKGGWLALWLHRLGATVHGFALNPPTDPSLFEVARIETALASDVRADLADLDTLTHAFETARPEVVFHLAAQPLVRESYRDPLGTLTTNVMGTAHVLEAARATGTARAVVLVTTDKVYENREERDYAYRERDALGGHDPYSASKAAAEIVAASLRVSFFQAKDDAARVATARAGNVIGGADWATDRLVPDCLRAFERGEAVRLRYPDAVRPWQHVLEPLSGYLRLAERLLGREGTRYADAWNFGPDESGDATVGQVADMAARLWGEGARVEHAPAADNPHEAGFLRLDSTRARKELDWRPRWRLTQALEHTVAWHRAWARRADMLAFSNDQLAAYEEAGRS